MNRGKLFFFGFLVYFLFFPSLMFEDNQKCQVYDNITKMNLEGTCKNISECSDYSNYLYTSDQTPQSCGINNNTPSSICCPSIPVGAKSTRWCSRYLEDIEQLRSFPKFIERGEPALPKEFGHMVTIGYIDENNKTLWLCGGSVISYHFVISAAHCANSSEYGPPSWLRVGDLDLNDTADDADTSNLPIDEIFIHPGYKSPSHHNDIVLFKTEEFINFGEYVRPICLNIHKAPSYDYLEIIGWGRQGYLGDTSSYLLKAEVGIVSLENCRRRYASVSKRKLPGGINDNLQICAGDTEGRDTCPGDSGGPLHFLVPNDHPNEVLKHFVLVGITSFGKGCGGPNSIGIYTKVSSYIEWIENIVWPSNKLPAQLDWARKFFERSRS